MQHNGLQASLGPRPLSFNSHLLNRHPTQLAHYSVSQPSFKPTQSQATEAAVDRLVAIPHILENIVAHASRSTQVTLLRVCHDFHRMAGKQVYRVIKFNNDNLLGIMRGALIGTGSRRIMSNACNEIVTEFLNIADPKMLVDLTKRFIERGDEIEDLALDVVIGNRAASYTPYGTNFKRSLFKNTEVLTVGTHHRCFCGVFGEVWATHFPNLRTLRVAPSKSEMPFELAHTCDSPAACPLLTGLKPRKIVVRNLDGGGICVPNSYTWDVPGLETVVYFLPVDQREYSNDRIVMSLFAHFESAAELKIVFYDQHEGTVGVDEAIQRTVLGRMAVNPDNIMNLIGAASASRLFTKGDLDTIHAPDDALHRLRQIRGASATSAYTQKCTVYGVGALNFDMSHSLLVPLYHRLFPSHAMNRKKVVEIVKKEAQSPALWMLAQQPWIPFDRAAFEKGLDWVTFKSIGEYNKDKAERSAEINAED